MDRREFNALVAYLRNRPEEAARLADVLGASPRQGCCTWVGTRAAAEELGKSVTWLKAHLELFPGKMKTGTAGGRCAWKFKKEELRETYEEYLQARRLCTP